jgi:hypothetical protein
MPLKAAWISAAQFATGRLGESPLHNWFMLSKVRYRALVIQKINARAGSLHRRTIHIPEQISLFTWKEKRWNSDWGY